MNQIIKVKNSAYDLYVDLLMKKEEVEKEASLCLVAYTKEFGKWMIESYQMKIACIEKKKKIAFCQRKINENEKIIQSELDSSIQATMLTYYDTLETMNEDYQLSKETSTISEASVHQIKQLYRKIAKQIHPDMHPEIQFAKKLKDLWNRVNIAYRCNDLDELMELDVLIQRQLNHKDVDIQIEDIDEKIRKLEEKINHILSTTPYTYRELLKDPIAVAKKKNELKKEITEYKKYAKELDEILLSFPIERVMN